MILEAVHLPSLFAIDHDAQTAKLSYAVCISILQDALENCVLVRDPDKQMQQELHSVLGRWPPQRRKEALTILKQLEKRNRFVFAPVTYGVDEGCSRVGCRHALGIAATLQAPGLIGPSSCLCRTTCSSEALRVITPEAYSRSSFANRRRREVRHELLVGDSSARDFENKVLEPVFRYAKHVKLFDRVVGHRVSQLVENVGVDPLEEYLNQMNEGADPRPLIEMPRNFAESLRWMFRQFLAHSPPAGSFEFTTEVGPMDTWGRPGQRQLAAAACVLQQFASRESGTMMARQRKTPFRMKVKLGKTTASMPHARFLFTDQISLVVDRGFDLLDGANIRDVFVNHAEDPGRVEGRIDSLEDAPLPRQVLLSSPTAAPII